MAEAKAPHPGMGQDEKDRLGLLVLREQERDSWAADESLDDMTKEELEAEAAVRRVDLGAAKTNPSRVKALREVDPLPDRGRVPAQEADGEPEAEAADDTQEITMGGEG